MNGVVSEETRKKLFNANRKFTNAQVKAIRNLKSKGKTNTAIAEKYGVNRSTISRINRGERYQFV